MSEPDQWAGVREPLPEGAGHELPNGPWRDATHDRCLRLQGAEDVETIVKALHTSHTWCLDALGNCILSSRLDGIQRCLAQRERLLRLLSELGHPTDDHYRMQHLRGFAAARRLCLDEHEWRPSADGSVCARCQASDR